MDPLWHGLQWLAGAGKPASDINAWQASFRAFFIYLCGWALLRIGGNRFLGRETAFDAVLGFILGSTLSRAIDGSSTLLMALGAGAVMVAFHHLMSWAMFRSPALRVFFSGRARALIHDGEVLPEEMRRHRFSIPDLDEALRLKGQVDDLGKVKEARFERSGRISVVKKEPGEPRIVEVRVEQGVQTVRIEIG